MSNADDVTVDELPPELQVMQRLVEIGFEVLEVTHHGVLYRLPPHLYP
jgi:hypothetical protein